MSIFFELKLEFSEIRENCFPGFTFRKELIVKQSFRRILFLLIPCLLFLPAKAESLLPASPLQTLMAELHSDQEKLDDALPKVIDHIHTPGEYADFSFSGEDDLLEIWFPSVRDQDAAIFLYQGQVWMLDCGDERAESETVPLLKYLGIDHIDRLINTHPHHDHLNGLYSIDAAIPIRELLICFPEDSTIHMAAALEYCKGNGISVSYFEDESILSMGDGLVSFLSWMKVRETENLNDRSAQFMITYGQCRYLTMADMELRGQNQLLAALGPDPLKADILRYPHHGKKQMAIDLYRAISPSLVIITNAPRILELADSTRFLGYQHASVAYTNQNLYILHLTTDGNHWLCEEIEFDPAPYLVSAQEETEQK